MAEASLVRTVRFRAVHHYRRGEWTAEENQRAFGAATEPHEHHWSLEVTIRGEMDEGTGFVADLGLLDERLHHLVDPLRQGSLNDVIPEVREGGMIPTTESLARWFWERLARHVPDGARLVRVRVAESDALAAEYEG